MCPAQTIVEVAEGGVHRIELVLSCCNGDRSFIAAAYERNEHGSVAVWDFSRDEILDYDVPVPVSVNPNSPV